MTQLVDILLVIAFALTALAGLRNGFFREMFSLFGLVIGVLAGMHFTGPVAEWIGIGLFNTELGVTLLFVLVFLIVFGSTVLIGNLLAMIWEGKSPSGASRMAGLGFGALRGLLLVTVLAGAICMLAPIGSEALGRSRVLPWLSPGVGFGANLLPSDLRDQLQEHWEALPFDRNGSRSIQI